MAQKIGDLFFELGLDDSKLQQQWKKAVAKYEKASLNVKLNIDSRSLADFKKQLNGLNIKTMQQQMAEFSKYIGQAAGSARDLAKSTENIASNLKGAVPAAQQVDGAVKQTGRNAGVVNDKLRQQKGVWQELIGYAKRYVSVWGAVSLGKSIIRITGEIEYQRRALESVMQNAQKANEIWGDIQKLAVKSPFQVGDLLKYTKQLSAFGIENEHLFDTLKRLADVSAGLGVDLSRIALAYGEINAATVLRGKETRQLTQAGIPIIRELAKSFSELEGRMVSAGEVYKRIFTRQVSFDMVKKVFEELTSEGGKFYQMQEKQAATLKGSIKNIADQWTLMANQIGESQSDWIKSLVSGLKSAMAAWKNWIGVVEWGAATLVLFKVGVQGVVTALNGLKLAASGALSLSGWGTLATVVTMVSVAIYKVVSSLSALEKIEKAATDGAEAWAKEELSVTIQLDRLYNKLKLAKKGTEEYEEARKTIIRAYPEYFDKLRAEGKEIGDLEAHYVSLRDSALEAARARVLAGATEQASKAYGDAIADYINPDSSWWKRQKGYKGKVLSQVDIDTIAKEIANPGSVMPDKLAAALGFTRSNWKGTWEEAVKYFKAASSTGNQGRVWGVESTGEVLKVDHDLWMISNAWNIANSAAEKYSNTLERIDKITGHFIEEEDGPPLTDYLVEQGQLLGWQKKAREILTKGGFNEDTFKSLWPGVSTSSAEYSETIKKQAKEIKNALDNAIGYSLGPEVIEGYRKQLKAVRELAKTFGVDITTKADKNAEKEAEQEARKKVRAIDEQFQWVEYVRKYYKELKDLGYSTQGAQAIISKIFEKNAVLPDGMTFSEAIFSDYEAILETFKNEYLKIGGDDATKAANNVAQKITSKKAQDAIETLKAQKKFLDDMKEWGAHDFIIEGESGMEKLSKLSAELTTKQQTLELKKEERLAEARRLFTGEVLKEQEAKINELYELERKYNIAIAQQRMESFGEAFAKNATKELDIAFRNAGRKSIAYLKSELEKFRKVAKMDFGLFGDESKAIIKKAKGITLKENGEIEWNSLGKMSEEDFSSLITSSGLTENQIENLKVLRKMAKNEENLDKLLQVIAKELGIKLESAKETTAQQQIKVWDAVLGGIGSLGSSVGGWGGKAISGIANSAKSAYKIYQNRQSGKGSENTATYISMIAEGAVGIYNAISGIIDKNKRTVREWRDALNEASQAVRRNAIAQKEYKEANVWGVESPYAKMEAAAKQYWTARAQFSSLAESIAEKGKYRKGIKRVVDADTTVETGLGGMLLGAGIGGLIGEEYGALIGGIIGLIGGTAGGAAARKKTITLKKLTDIFGPNFYDPKTLELNQKILNDYALMNEETKKLIDNWEEIREEMEKAEEEMENQIKELTGDLGNDIKTMLVSAFSDGDIFAAIDDIDEYLGQKIKELALQSAFAGVFQDVFTTLQDRMKASFDPTTGDGTIADDLLWLRDILPQRVKAFSNMLELLQDELYRNGIDMDLGGSNTTSSAISSVTEETASRLVGLINGMRGDVSVKRELLETYLPQVSLINENISLGLTTLKDIEINTRRGADIGGEIRDLLSSMMGVSNSSAGMALNVNIG